MFKISVPSLPEIRILGLGAEAKVYTSTLFGKKVICKERIPKNYRDPNIDFRLRKERTTQEIRLLQSARSNGLPVPKVLDLDKAKWSIVMEYLSYPPLKEKIGLIDVEQIFKEIGRIIARLHKLDIIHGDLTTSNLLIDDQDSIYIIDFGLGKLSHLTEDKAVDLLVLKHILESSHADVSSKAIEAFIGSYKEHYERGEEVVKRLSVVEGRVRYRTHEIS